MHYPYCSAVTILVIRISLLLLAMDVKKALPGVKVENNVLCLNTIANHFAVLLPPQGELNATK